MSKGIDIPIDVMITDFTAELWTTKTCQFYGRIFRSPLNGKIQPLYYTGQTAIEVLKDDRKDAQCFVDVQPTRKMFADIIEAECRVYFMVNLLSLYPLFSRTEAIEQVMQDVADVLMSSRFETIQMVSGYEAFNDFDFSDIPLADLQNNHLFRFDLKIIYTNLQ